MTTPSFTEAGLSNGTQYRYWVTAVNTSNEESDYDGPVTVTPQVPQPPQGRAVNYCFDYAGNVDNRMFFEFHVRDILDDSRGWQAAGLTFHQKFCTPYLDFEVVLADTHKFPRTHGCRGRSSCLLHHRIFIRDVHRYRYLARNFNFELGRVLGLKVRTSCPAQGALAPIMMVPWGDLKGCRPGDWPTPKEIKVAQALNGGTS